MISGSSVVRALVAIPTFQGESLEKLTIQGYACSDSNVQPDSPIHMDWAMGWFPFDFVSSVTGASLTTGNLESYAAQMFAPSGTGEPNPSGEDPVSPFQIFGQWESMWSRESLLYSKLHTQSETATVIQKSSHVNDRFTETFKKRLFWQTSGFILIGVEMPDVAAQTDFGVAEIDTGLNADIWWDIFRSEAPTEFAELSADQRQAYELIYGGDTFIEADTWKSDAVRAYALVQAVFKTPYPEPGKEFRMSG